MVDPLAEARLTALAARYGLQDVWELAHEDEIERLLEAVGKVQARVLQESFMRAVKASGGHPEQVQAALLSAMAKVDLLLSMRGATERYISDVLAKENPQAARELLGILEGDAGDAKQISNN